MTDPDLALSIAMDEARLLRRSIEALVKVIEEHEAEIDRLRAENEERRRLHDLDDALIVSLRAEVERLRSIVRDFLTLFPGHDEAVRLAKKFGLDESDATPIIKRAREALKGGGE